MRKEDGGGRRAPIGPRRRVREFLLGSPASRRGQAALDWWTVPHVASGVVLAALLSQGFAILALVTVYEAFEALLRRVKTKEGAGVFEYESWPNIVADILVAMVPWLVVKTLFPGYDAPLRFW